MKYIIAQAGNEGEWFSKDIALINLHDDVGEKIKRALEFIRLSPEEFRNNISIDIYGVDVEFLDSDTMEEDSSDDTQKILVNLNLFSGSIIELSDDFDVSPFLGECENLSSCRAVVSNNCIIFAANNDYGNGEEVYSYPIDLEVIEAFLAGTAPTNQFPFNLEETKKITNN